MRNLMLLALLALATTPAVAGSLPAGGSACFELSWGVGQSFRDCAAIDSATGLFDYKSDTPFGDGSSDGFSVTSLTFGGNADPVLGYGLAVTDFGAPSVFGFSFFTPIVSDAYTHAATSIDILLNGADGTSVSIAPVAPATKLQTSAAGTPLPGTPLGIDVGAACSGSGLVVCPGETAETFFAPTTYAGLAVAVAFELSGGGDSAAITGSLTLDKATQQVPEPGTLLLLGAGIVALFRRHARR